MRNYLDPDHDSFLVSKLERYCDSLYVQHSTIRGIFKIMPISILKKIKEVFLVVESFFENNT